MEINSLHTDRNFSLKHYSQTTAFDDEKLRRYITTVKIQCNKQKIQSAICNGKQPLGLFFVPVS